MAHKKASNGNDELPAAGDILAGPLMLDAPPTNRATTAFARALKTKNKKIGRMLASENCLFCLASPPGLQGLVTTRLG